ncbi:MAG TPA: hypothetical protein VNI20_00595, partial [Fimbriimonadaceae bacterium]|nr:hypothetical protein [Fimbriimonadaceae bacterium]
PSSLKEVNADLSDPLANGKPIQAVFAPGSLTVWSVGRNHVDDGGEIRGPSHKTADDIALRWPSRTK